MTSGLREENPLGILVEKAASKFEGLVENVISDYCSSFGQSHSIFREITFLQSLFQHISIPFLNTITVFLPSNCSNASGKCSSK